MSISLKDRIAGAERAAVEEESPIAALFRNPTEATEKLTEQTYPQFREVPIELMDEMEQPFRLYDGTPEMESLVEKIREQGIVERLIVRPSPTTAGRYQIIAGRHRRRAAKQLGYTAVPCEIRNLTDDEATLQMIATNVDRREKLLPSERAWAYRMRLEALRRKAGRPTKENCGQIDHNLRSVDLVAEGADDSRKNVQRYIRLTYLLPELLELVDQERLGFGVGVSLSYLSEQSQRVVYHYFFEVNSKLKINGVTAEALRVAGEREELTDDVIHSILFPKSKQVKPLKKVSVQMKSLRKFFPAELPPKEIEKQIIEIVTAYFERQGHRGVNG